MASWKELLAFAHAWPKESVETASKEDVLARYTGIIAARASEELFLDVNYEWCHRRPPPGNRIGLQVCWSIWHGWHTDINKQMTLEWTVPKFNERVEAVLQSQFKAVKRFSRT